MNAQRSHELDLLFRMLGHQSPEVTLETYNRFVPNLTREDGRALLEASKKAKRSGPPEKNKGQNQ